MISSYSDLIQASYSQQEPQRLLFVFCRAELPDEASPEEKAAFERGEGGALTPVVCVDKTPMKHRISRRCMKSPGPRASPGTWCLLPPCLAGAARLHPLTKRNNP